ncbi:hypothetical protein JW758_06220 [Candidatus Peregrinibacteria bacterium]|nr:hypothetical protein [Candidatus Peregrinibacteria bacterium]
MKKTILTLIISLLLFAPVYADSMQKVRVIKFDKSSNDLIIEQNSGERLLIQHNRVCNSMSTEWPINLIWKNDELTQLKIAYNEICDVYNWGPYSDTVKIYSRTRNTNPLIKEHIAELEWNNKIYEIDYGDGCEDLRNVVGKNAYIYTPKEGSLNNATLYLPSNRGQCKLNSTEFVEELEVPESVQSSPITNLQFKAENNESFFVWDEDTSDKKWIFLIAYSKYKLDPDDYHYRQMPNLRFAVKNSYTAKRLVNNQKYYFYLSARDHLGNIAPWQEVEVTPILTRNVLENNIESEEFEVEIAEETDDYYLLSWPDKSENSKRYMINFYINGKRKFMKIIPGDQHTYKIEKLPENEGVGYRFTVRSIATSPYGARYSDGIYWK